MSIRKEYSELTFVDDFMFCKIMVTHPELCKELLELILNVKIRKIEFPESQKVMEETYDGRGIRLDVYIKDDNNTIYDLEMQTTKKRDLPKRTRYYQGMIDINLIGRNAKFRELKKSYVIFICTSDPFKIGLPVYTFENICIQEPSLSLGDDAYKVIINADGNREGLSEEMSDFLDFLQGKENNGKLSEKLEKAVSEAIQDGIWKEEYDMTWKMKLNEEREDAAIEERISAAFEYGVSEVEILQTLMSKFQLSEEEARERLEEYKSSLQFA